MIPLQIRFQDATVATLPVSVVASVQTTLEFALVHECEHGLTLYAAGEDFACHSASCRPPTSGGTGGSKDSGAGGESKSTGGEGGKFLGGGPGTLGGGVERKVGQEQHASDMHQLIASNEKDFLNNHTNPDGTLGLPFTVPGGGGKIEFDAKMQKFVDDKLADLGVTHEELVNNLVADGASAINSPQAAAAIRWYDTEHEWGSNLASTYDVSPERIFAAVSLTSAMRKWGVEGTGTNASSTNKGVIETILKKLKDDEPFEVTREMADSFNTFKGEKKGIGEGAHIEPGPYRPSDLSSASIARLATGLGWKVLNSAGTKPVAKAIAVIRGEISVNDAVRGTKQRSFVSNLAHPEIDYTSTNDLWHFRAVAGNSLFNFPDRRKDESGASLAPKTGSKHRTTLDDYESHITGYNKKDGKAERGNAPHDIFTGGPPNSGLYTEVTRVTRDALDRLASSDVRFRGMKIHEFQALVWKYAGGNAGSDTEA